MPEDLGAVEEIPSDIFNSIDKEDVKLYSLVLSLSIFYNNLRDIFIFYQLINSELKNIKKTNNPARGQNGGALVFIDKLFDAYMYEFMKLINENISTFESKKFQKQFISKMNKKTRIRLCELKIMVTTDTKIFNTLEKLRNNLGFHYYQPKKLFQGYQKSIADNKLYISLGPKVMNTRYYFADLACQKAKTIIINECNFTINQWGEEIRNALNCALYVCMNTVTIAITNLCAPTPAKEEGM